MVDFRPWRSNWVRNVAETRTSIEKDIHNDEFSLRTHSQAVMKIHASSNTC